MILVVSIITIFTTYILPFLEFVGGIVGISEELEPSRCGHKSTQYHHTFLTQVQKRRLHLYNSI